MCIRDSIRGICNQLVATQMKRRNQKRQFDFILANMNEGFLMVDTDKRVIALNGSAAQILGCLLYTSRCV